MDVHTHLTLLCSRWCFQRAVHRGLLLQCVVLVLQTSIGCCWYRALVLGFQLVYGRLRLSFLDRLWYKWVLGQLNDNCASTRS